MSVRSGKMNPLWEIEDIFQNHYLQMIADCFPVIVWIAKSDGNIVGFNQSAIHPEDLSKFDSKWKECVEQKSEFQLEFRYKNPSDEKYYWHLGKARPVRNRDGEIMKWFGICFDIDKQKNIQKQLQEDTFRLNQIILTQFFLAKAELQLENFMALAIQQIEQLTPASGVVIELADGEDMLYEATSVNLQHFKGLRLQQNNSLSGTCVGEQKVIYCKNVENDPRVNLDACKKIGVSSMIVAPLFHQSKAIGVLKVLSDKTEAFNERDIQTLELITGLVGAAISHQINFDTINNLLTEKTQALDDLEKEIEKRIELEEVKNELVSIVSHELRTPLTSIRASLGLVTSGALEQLTDRTKQVLEIASNNCERLIRLINDVLDVQKLESGKVELNYTKIEMNTLIQEIIDANNSFGEKYQVKILFKKLPDAFYIMTDADKLTQILTNLISNAVKVSTPGKSVTVIFEKNQTSVKIAVIDEGPGIPPEFQPHIFQKFRQGKTTKSSMKGTGLGLHICKSLIEKMHGTINFKTSPQEGTCFHFELPIHQST